jgi:hypothetical protein
MEGEMFYTAPLCASDIVQSELAVRRKWMEDGVITETISGRKEFNLATCRKHRY